LFGINESEWKVRRKNGEYFANDMNILIIK